MDVNIYIDDEGKVLKPHYGRDVFKTSTSTVIGDVKIGDGSSLWFNTVIRGDVMPIRIGANTNIQDGTVIHGTYKKFGTTIGDRVSVGHSCVIHGSTVDDLCLIGMGSILMDGCHIPKNSIVGAGSLVTQNSKFESGYLIMGRPAKQVRKLNEDELAFLHQSSENYIKYKTWYKKGDE
ncbi:gamma carbonic anhydrase family protein [bacterium]|nr:gamma carbonic anhydrase family protein [bacterium]